MSGNGYLSSIASHEEWAALALAVRKLYGANEKGAIGEGGEEVMGSGDFKLTFGSYRNRTIAEIYKTDRQYVLWLRDETQGPAQKAAEAFIRAENIRIISEGKLR